MTGMAADDELLALHLSFGFLTLDLRMRRADFAMLGVIAAAIVWLSTRHLSRRRSR
jgi:hypothetical protein